MRSSALLATALLCGTAGALPGQGSEGTTRELRTVVDSFFAAVDSERWHEAARFVDAGTFERWFSDMVASGRSRLPEPEETVERIMERNPGMPRAAAEWELAQRQSRQRSSWNEYAFRFAGVTSFRDLQALTPREAAARWLEAQGHRHRSRLSLAALWECSPAVIDSMARLLPATRHRVLGVLTPRSGVGYALFESSHLDRLADGQRPPPDVLTLRRTPEGWRIPVGFATRLESHSAGVSVSSGSSSPGQPPCPRRQ